MRIPYNVAYQSNFVLTAGKRPTSRILYATDGVNVPEVSEVDAPVVASWKSQDLNNDRSLVVRTYDVAVPFNPARRGCS
jgi:hypothetical protein